jgi:type IX secretion system PorP/SprF family membrane protein
MRILVLSFALLVAQLVNAQQLPQYSQYIFNGLAINPAYAGSKKMLSVNATYRSQWMNVDGAPTTQLLSIDGSSPKKAAYGFQFENDRVGAQGRLSMLGTYAYRIPVSLEGRLAFGLSGGVERYSVNKGLITTVDANDPLVMNLSEHSWRPDARFGVFYNNVKFYAGVSMANILSDINFNDNVIGVHRHYFFNTGYLFNISDRVKFKPGLMIKEDFHAPTNIDLNAFVLLDERLWLGSSFRTGARIFNSQMSRSLVKRDAIVAAAEYYISDNFRVGYSYDFDIAGLRSFNTHELSLGYYFMKKQDSPMVSPRYF